MTRPVPVMRYYLDSQLANLSRPGEPTSAGDAVRTPTGRLDRVVSFCADSQPRETWARGVKLEPKP